MNIPTTASITTAITATFLCTAAVLAQAASTQEVFVSGSAVNTAVGAGGSAAMNAASTRGVARGGNNRQQVVINGSAINTAIGSGKAETRLGSVNGVVSGDNAQNVVIGGSVTNIAGPGVTSKIEIDHR